MAFFKLFTAATCTSLVLLLTPQARAEKPLPTPTTTSPIAVSPTGSAYDQFMRLGYAAMKRKDYRVAAQYFRYALYENPKDKNATIAYWNAKDAVKDGANSPPETAYERYMENGYDATEEEEYQKAIASFRKALELRPGDYYAIQAIRNVNTYINRGQKPSSPDLNTIPAYYPGEAPYDRYMRLGYAAVQRKDFSSGLTYFRSALYERPNDRQATIAYWNAKGEIKDKKDGNTQTENKYDRFMRLGYDASERENYQKALDFFQKALKERPRDYYATQAIRNVQTYIRRAEKVTGQ
ncbi:MAG: hypothetical protein AAF378_21045 [Cyanobacteria bacterium P01_A01_bin.84]